MSLTEHAQKGKEEMGMHGINTPWGAAVAILYKFGAGMGSVIGIGLVLIYACHLFYAQTLTQAEQILAAKQETINILKDTIADRGTMIQNTTSAIEKNTTSNKDLASSIDRLRDSLPRNN